MHFNIVRRPGLVLGLLALAATSVHASSSYEVFAPPLQSPDMGPRTVEVDPELQGGIASPFGWHDTDGSPGAEYTITRGNNVYAYLDVNEDDLPDVNGAPDGGAGLSFQFPLNLTQSPSTYGAAAVTNAFYWMNAIHDILYNAGFDEAAGNFQESNYGRGGLGGDAIQFEIQDGGFLNNAIWFPLDQDGVAPRFQVGLFNLASPNRDGAFGHDLLGFLYGAATAWRLVGGPGDTTCLIGGFEIEGIAFGFGDWLSILITARASDQAADRRTIANYLLGQAPPAPTGFCQTPSCFGIRQRPYTTDMTVNELTYGSFASLSSGPQSAGTVWATMLWEVYWQLVDAYGFSADLNGDPSSGGNVLALHLVVESLKRMPCDPGFVDARDALLDADVALTGGANCQLIWTAFAKRGLGYSADQGSPSSITDGTEAFDMPPDGTCPDLPVPVKLASFSVQRSGPGAVLAWEVVEATDHAGFHVYRQLPGKARVQMTEQLLSGQGRYRFQDVLAPRGAADYWLAEIGRTGTTSWHGPVTLSAAASTPRVTLAALPNPFRSTTTIAYSLAQSQRTNLSIYDIHGRRVKTLHDRVQDVGEHVAAWDGRTDGGIRAAFGFYLVKLDTGGEVMTRKVVLTP